jgi:uncharacterized protein (TIGR02996 family)
MPRYELSDGSSNKFWEITLGKGSFTVRFGKIGANGQIQLEQFANDAAARLAYDKLIAERVAEGYALAGGKRGSGSQTFGSPRPAPERAPSRSPELEKAIDANPYDADAYSVLADWLQDQGDPRGELIALQLAGKHEQARALVDKQAGYFLGPLAEHQKTYDGADTDAFTWKYGFIHAARLSHDRYVDDDFEGSLAKILDQLLRHPSGRFLAEITFVFNGGPSEDNLQDLIDLLVKRAPPTIRKLHFGDFGFCGPSDKTATGETEISWYAIGNLSQLWKAVPDLKTLITQCGSAESTINGIGVKLGTIDLPALAHAEFRSGGLERANVRAIATANIPSIEHLDIWFGDRGYGGNATANDVQLLLDRTDLPKLRHLGLRNAAFTDELPERLAASPLLRQLTQLDLSLGCMSDAGAQALARHRAAFEHLELLDVSENFLTRAGLAALEGSAKQLVAKEQRESNDPDVRYPAVGE